MNIPIRLAAVEPGTAAPAGAARLAFGAALHEVYAATPDATAAAGFALLVATAAAGAKPLFWVREDRGERRGGRLYAPGLGELGVDPQALVVVTAPDTLALLRAGADIVRCTGIGAVILEPWGRATALDLTASRRLALAAARSQVLTMVLRIDAEPVPSAAQTRWRLHAAPSQPLATGAPGAPAFDISLLRHRGGVPAFDARVEWDRDRNAFRDAPLPRGVPAVAQRRTRTADLRRVA